MYNIDYTVQHFEEKNMHDISLASLFKQKTNMVVCMCFSTL